MKKWTSEHSLEILAGGACLIATAALVALISQGAWAQPPAKGFEPGSRAFTNPFAGNPNAQPTSNPPPFFDEEDDVGDEDDFDFPDQAVGAPAGNATGGYTPGRGSVASPPQAESGVSVGGQTNGGLISGSRMTPLTVDTETAAGCKEIVTDFNYPDADILDIAKALGKLTGKNFILDKDVKGRITIISNSPITCGDAWKAFLTALDINGYALIPSGKYVRIARQRDARDKQLKTYTGESSPDTDALITRVFPLKYLSSEEVARNFRSFMPANSRIIPYEQTNTVIVTDTGSNIAKLSKLLEILDVEGFDAGIEVIPVKYASAVELSKLIDTLIPGNPTQSTAGGAPRFGGGRTNFTSRRTKEGGIINTIISDERTNTLIVHANSKGADQVRELVTRLDQKLPATQGGGKVHVIYLQFADAEQIANTLNNLSQKGAAPPSGGAGGTGTNPTSGNLFEGAIRISPDKSTNSLVVTASPTDFSIVQRVINRLDIPRDQVYAEIVIMEITLQRESSYSANIASPTQGIGLMPNGDLIDFITKGPIGRGATLGIPIGGKKNFTVGGTTFPVANVQGLIKAIQTKSNGNILATPQILALDNTEATFETSEKIPVAVSNAVAGVITTTIQKEPVSLTIKLKPQINKVANFVKLDIDAKLEDISNREPPPEVAGKAFATVSRSAKTSVVVADQDTVVLGGLVRDNHSDQMAKIPILGDIPILGWLFKSKSTTLSKTNLLIFITPSIVRQYESIRAILDKKLRERDEFIESTTGGEDSQRKYRDQLIRGLPDMKELLSKKPDRVVSLDDDIIPNPAAKAVIPQSSSNSGNSGSNGPNAPAIPMNNAIIDPATGLPMGGVYQGDPLGAPLPPAGVETAPSDPLAGDIPHEMPIAE